MGLSHLTDTVPWRRCGWNSSHRHCDSGLTPVRKEGRHIERRRSEFILSKCTDVTVDLKYKIQQQKTNTKAFDLKGIWYVCSGTFPITDWGKDTEVHLLFGLAVEFIYVSINKKNAQTSLLDNFQMVTFCLLHLA